MLELQKGRPVTNEGRLEKEIRTYDFLDALGIAYKRIDHEAAMTMSVCEEIDAALQDRKPFGAFRSIIPLIFRK